VLTFGLSWSFAIQERKKEKKLHTGQGARTNQNDKNRAKGEGTATARVDFFAPQSSTTRTLPVKPA